MRISKTDHFNKNITASPDKSQTIRSILMGAMAEGQTSISNPLMSGDTAAAMDCIKRLGCEIQVREETITVRPCPFKGEFKLDAQNSATTLRLLAGIICGSEGVNAEISGDNSLNERNMSSLIRTLTAMGGKIESRQDRPPLSVFGKVLKDSEISVREPSAQIKSAALLAALRSSVRLSFCEPIKTRDYTERLIAAMGGNISINGNKIVLMPSTLRGIEIEIGGDPSSAAYSIAAALLTSGKAEVKGVSLSPERAGFIEVYRRMGAEINVVKTHESVFGEIFDIKCTGNIFRPFVVESNEIPALIDEIPLLSMSACFVKGTSVIKGAEMLRNKESDRIKATVEAVNRMGGLAKETVDGIVIEGRGGLKGGKVNSYGDHRIAMSSVVALLASANGGETDIDCIDISYPNFLRDVL